MADKESKELSKSKSKELATPVAKRFLSPFEEMEHWFEESFKKHFYAPWMPQFRFPEFREFSPSVDIFEDGNDVVVKAEIPGMSKDDIEVSISDNVISISGEKRTEEKIEKKNFARLERSYGSFSRRMTLPAEVQTDKVKAAFKDGILEVRIPKSEAAIQKVKKVKID